MTTRTATRIDAYVARKQVRIDDYAARKQPRIDAHLARTQALVDMEPRTGTMMSSSRHGTGDD